MKSPATRLHGTICMVARLPIQQEGPLHAQVGAYICVLKTHVDIFDQWDDAIVQQLQALAEKHGEQTFP